MLTDADYRAQADFRYAVRRFLHLAEVNARAAAITSQQHLLLLMVRGHPSYPAVSIAAIAARLQIRPNSASLLVDRAVNRTTVAGAPAPLLRRVQDATDRRRARVSLAPAGDEILARITAANRRVLADLDQASEDLRDAITRV